MSAMGRDDPREHAVVEAFVTSAIGILAMVIITLRNIGARLRGKQP